MKVRKYKILVRSKELISDLKRKRIEKVKKWENKIFVNLALKKNNKNETRPPTYTTTRINSKWIKLKHEL